MTLGISTFRNWLGNGGKNLCGNIPDNSIHSSKRRSTEMRERRKKQIGEDRKPLFSIPALIFHPNSEIIPAPSSILTLVGEGRTFFFFPHFLILSLSFLLLLTFLCTLEEISFPLQNPQSLTSTREIQSGTSGVFSALFCTLQYKL